MQQDTILESLAVELSRNPKITTEVQPKLGQSTDHGGLQRLLVYHCDRAGRIMVVRAGATLLLTIEITKYVPKHWSRDLTKRGTVKHLTKIDLNHPDSIKQLRDTVRLNLKKRYPRINQI